MAGSAGLYAENTPPRFWRVLGKPGPTQTQWTLAVQAAAMELPETARAAGNDIDNLLERTLGEGQFGPRHWRLSKARRLYYWVKPVLPRRLTRALRKRASRAAVISVALAWPIEHRYARFQWEVLRQLLSLTQNATLPFIHFWPRGHPYAFVLTHDVETADGQANVRMVADLDASYGFRSLFNFVPERYRLDRGLIEELRARGFEIGVHGLNHDGRLFSSRDRFIRKAARINEYLLQLGAGGFRAPLTHRQPEWMQELDIDYDLSFFDTDPFEPIPGGTMSIWPFTIGRFVELPYTLAQDYTLTSVLGQTTPLSWLQKVEFIRAYSGMALVNTHPDYLRSPRTLKIYDDFLRAMRARADYWHALPREVARWWRARAAATSVADLPEGVVGTFTDALQPRWPAASAQTVAFRH
jgi:peptidoglycan/xylan/chitin deacetylase (PgdA/CDA1 family)